MFKSLFILLPLVSCVAGLVPSFENVTKSNDQVINVNRAYPNYVASDFDYVFEDINNLPLLTYPYQYLGYTRNLGDATIYYNGSIADGTTQSLPYYNRGLFDSMQYSYTSDSFDFYSFCSQYSYDVHPRWSSYYEDVDDMVEQMGKLWEYNFGIHYGQWYYPAFPQFQLAINNSNYLSVWLYFDLDYLKYLVVTKGVFQNYVVYAEEWMLNDEYNDPGSLDTQFVRDFDSLNVQTGVWSSLPLSISTEEYMYLRAHLHIEYNDSNTTYNTGYEDGYTDGYDTGYRGGYNDGATAGSQLGNTLTSLFFSIADIPLRIMHSMFSFDLFGISLFLAIMSVLTIILIIWVVRKFI